MKITISRSMDITTSRLQNLNTGIEEVDYDITELIKNLVQSPANLENFYVCDVNDIIEKHTRWKQLMPRVKPFYAVKCNSHPILLRVLAALGLGFDCASNIEIEAILNLGVDPNRIIYAHPVKIIKHIKYASSRNVTYNTFDSEDELYKCKNNYPNAKMIVRIRCEASRASINYGGYGCDPYDEAPSLLKLAIKLQMNVVGVAFHLGPGCSDVLAYRNATEAAKFVFDYAESLGYTFKLLDIGGGFPGNKENCLDTFANVINPALESFFPDPSIRIVAEPGRYFVRSAFTLCCSIQGTKHLTTYNSETGSNEEKYMYYIAEGVYHSFSRVGYSMETVKPILVKEQTDGHLYKSTVWGQTCDSLDKIVEDVYLPKAELEDWFMFENMGDYTLSVSSSFNGFFSPDVFAAANKKSISFLMNKAPHLFNLSNAIESLDQ